MSFFAEAIRIAIAKAETPALRSYLSEILTLAQQLDDIEMSFEARVNASKAARGEKPTRLSKARRAQVDGYTADAKAVQAELLAQYQASLSSRQIAATLQAGLSGDLKFWRDAGKYAHPDELPLIHCFADAKAKLYHALAKLPTHPGDA